MEETTYTMNHVLSLTTVWVNLLMVLLLAGFRVGFFTDRE